MASKPAKAKHTQKVKDPNARVLVGKRVYYIGDMNCPVCVRKVKRGMVSEYQGKFYCSEGCVLKVVTNGN